MHKGFVVMMTVLAASLAGCDKRPSQDEAKARPLQAPATLRVEPVENTVTVLVPPSVPQELARREASVTSEHRKTEARVHELMNGYAQSLGDAEAEKHYQEQLASQLETYKQQSLELFKLQQRSAREQ